MGGWLAPRLREAWLDELVLGVGLTLRLSWARWIILILMSDLVLRLNGALVLDLA